MSLIPLLLIYLTKALYVSHSFASYLSNKGIVHHATCPHTTIKWCC
jgi:hypothetical protein